MWVIIFQKKKKGKVSYKISTVGNPTANSNNASMNYGQQCFNSKEIEKANSEKIK